MTHLLKQHFAITDATFIATFSTFLPCCQNLQPVVHFDATVCANTRHLM